MGHGSSWVYSYSHNHRSTRVPDITATIFLFRLPPTSRPTAKLHTFQASKEVKPKSQRQSQRTVLRKWHPPRVEKNKQPRPTAASMRAPRSGPMTMLPDHRPQPHESRHSPQAERYEHRCPYLNQEVPSPQSGLPCHPAFIHGLQVLQGWERWRWRELFDGRIRWEDKVYLVTSLGDVSKLVAQASHGTLGESRPLCLCGKWVAQASLPLGRG